MKRFVWPILVVCLCASAAVGGSWRQVHPYWEKAYVLSFRSPDLLTNDPDERWGADGRLTSGGILTDLEPWLRSHGGAIEEARRRKRRVLLSLHTHSGYGTGLVTYSTNLQRAQVANYPWLLRVLSNTGLNTERVTVVVDTCNAQATAAMQIRPDLVPAGVESFAPFKRWRARAKARRALPLETAWALFARDRVAEHLGRPARGKRANVAAVPFAPLDREERRAFRGRLYGQKGVIYATPGFFNLLRLGPDVRGTLTANLLTDRLSPVVIDSLLSQNKAEFRRFREFAFLDAAGMGEQAALRPSKRAARGTRAQRIEARRLDEDR